MTKVEAIKCVMNDNGGAATWSMLYRELKQYYPNIDAAEDWKAGVRGVLYREIRNNRNFKKIAHGLYALDSYNENLLLLSNEHFSTVSERMVATRNGQSELRKRALVALRECPITHITDKRLLIVSHIKPWVFSNDVERLDINNVFLLSPLYDKLFDSGLITFTAERKIIVSDEISTATRSKIGLINGKIIKALPITSKREEYLEFHQNKIFI